MAITCNVCYYDRNSDKNQFCEVCGSEIRPSMTLAETPEKGLQGREAEIFHKSINQNINNYPLTTSVSTDIPTSSLSNVVAQETSLSPINPSNPTIITGTVAKLIPKQVGVPIPEFIIDSNNAIIGKFHPELGPVEIDLDGFYGDDTVSSTHAEIYFENNQWHIKDLGSSNGIYIKPTGKTRFGYRINKSEILNSGDEIAIGKIRLLFLLI